MNTERQLEAGGPFDQETIPSAKCDNEAPRWDKTGCWIQDDFYLQLSLEDWWWEVASCQALQREMARIVGINPSDVKSMLCRWIDNGHPDPKDWLQNVFLPSLGTIHI